MNDQQHQSSSISSEILKKLQNHQYNNNNSDDSENIDDDDEDIVNDDDEDQQDDQNRIYKNEQIVKFADDININPGVNNNKKDDFHEIKNLTIKKRRQTVDSSNNFDYKHLLNINIKQILEFLRQNQNSLDEIYKIIKMKEISTNNKSNNITKTGKLKKSSIKGAGRGNSSGSSGTSNETGAAVTISTNNNNNNNTLSTSENNLNTSILKSSSGKSSISTDIRNIYLYTIDNDDFYLMCRKQQNFADGQKNIEKKYGDYKLLKIWENKSNIKEIVKMINLKFPNLKWNARSNILKNSKNKKISSSEILKYISKVMK